MDDELLILGGAVILLYLLSGKQEASGGLVPAAPGVPVPGEPGACVQPGCAAMGTGGSPGGASPVSPAPAPAAQVIAPAPGLYAGGPTAAQITASNAAGYAYVDPASARQSWQTGPYNPYWYGG